MQNMALVAQTCAGIEPNYITLSRPPEVALPSKIGNLRSQGRIQTFKTKMSQKALNRVLTLESSGGGPEFLISSGIIDLQNNRVCKQLKH